MVRSTQYPYAGHMYLYATKRPSKCLYRNKHLVYSRWSKGGNAQPEARNLIPLNLHPLNKTTKTPITCKKSKNNSQTKNKNTLRDKNPGNSNDNLTNIHPGKLKQTSILTFVGKGVKRKEETQLTPQWAKKLNTRIIFKPMSKRAKNANIKMVKELITDIIETIFLKQVSPMFAHLVSYKNLGKVSKKL